VTDVAHPTGIKKGEKTMKMKGFSLIVIVLFALLTACGTAPARAQGEVATRKPKPSSAPTNTTQPTQSTAENNAILPSPFVSNNDKPEAVVKAQDFLAAELGISADEVQVVSYESVEWPDRCLGVIIIGQMCAQGITPGYKVMLQAQGQPYELHTDQTGESIREVREIPQ
jgi:hypothetical protein